VLVAISISTSDSVPNLESGKSLPKKPAAVASKPQRSNRALELMIGSMVGMVQVGRLDQAGGFPGF